MLSSANVYQRGISAIKWFAGWHFCRSKTIDIRSAGEAELGFGRVEHHAGGAGLAPNTRCAFLY